MSNIGSSKQTTSGSSFSQVRAPDFINAPLQNAANMANQQFGGTAPESAITSGARNLAEQTIGGQFLGPNPYLDSVINQGANQIQNQVQSRFAGSGRNVGGPAAQRQFADTLTQFAAPLYAQNYESERGRQQNALFQSSQFDPLNQFIARLGPLAAAAGSDISSTSSGTTRDSASPLDTFLGLFG